MRKTVMMTFVCLALAFMVYAGSAAPAQNSAAAALTGTWQCVSHGGENGDLAFTLTLQQDGETVTGHVSSSIGAADLNSATFKDNHLHIVIVGDENTYTLEAGYKDGQLSGTWSTSAEKGTWEGKKAAEAK